MNFKELSAEDFRNFTIEEKEWLINYLNRDGAKIADEDDFVNRLSEITYRHQPIYFFDGDWEFNNFSFDREGGIIIVRGNIDTVYMHLYGITKLLVTKNISTGCLITADSSFEVWGDLTVSDGLVLSDTSVSMNVRNSIKAHIIINIVDDDDFGDYIKFGSIEAEEVYISENSYDGEGSKVILQKMGFTDIKEMSREDLSEYF